MKLNMDKFERLFKFQKEFTELKIREEPYVKALELRVKYLEARIKQLSDEMENYLNMDVIE